MAIFFRNAFCLFCLAFLPLSAQSAAAVVSKHLEAVGGAERLSTIRELYLELEVSFEDNYGKSILGHEKKWISDRKSVLSETTMGPTSNWWLVNRAGLWKKGPADDAPVLVTEEPHKLGHILNLEMDVYEQFPPFYLMDYDKRGLQLSLLKGTRKVGKNKCYILQTTKYHRNPKGKNTPKITKYYIGTKDYLLYRMEKKEQRIDISDYKIVNGILIPHKETRKVESRRSVTNQGKSTLEIQLRAIQINPELPEDFFTVARYQNKETTDIKTSSTTQKAK